MMELITSEDFERICNMRGYDRFYCARLGLDYSQLDDADREVIKLDLLKRYSIQTLAKKGGARESTPPS